MLMIILEIDSGDKGKKVTFIDCRYFDKEMERLSALIRQQSKREGHQAATMCGNLVVPDDPQRILGVVPFLAEHFCYIQAVKGERILPDQVDSEKMHEYQLPQIIYELPPRVRRALEHYVLYLATMRKGDSYFQMVTQIVKGGGSQRYHLKVRVQRWLKLPNGEKGDLIADERVPAHCMGQEDYMFDEPLRYRENQIVQINWPSGVVTIPTPQEKPKAKKAKPKPKLKTVN